MIEYGIVKLLKSDVNVSAIVGSRIYINTMPADSENYDDKILIQCDQRPKNLSKDIFSGSEELTFTITALSETYRVALDIANLIFDAINNYKGTQIIDGGINIVFEHCYQISDSIGYNDEINQHLVMSNYRAFADIIQP